MARNIAGGDRTWKKGCLALGGGATLSRPVRHAARSRAKGWAVSRLTSRCDCIRFSCDATERYEPRNVNCTIDEQVGTGEPTTRGRWSERVRASVMLTSTGHVLPLGERMRRAPPELFECSCEAEPRRLVGESLELSRTLL